MEVNWSKSCREPFRGEVGGDLVAEAAVVSLGEAFGIVWAALARAGRQIDV